MNKLTPKQKTFCQEYLVDLNGTQAAIRAGYSKKTANVQSSQLLAKLNIQTYIEQLQEERTKKTGVTQEYVITNLQRVVEMSVRAIPVMVKENGELVESGEYKFDSYGANKALELLGKHLGMFKENEKDPTPTVNLYQLLPGGNNGDLEDETKLKERFGVLYPTNGRGSDRL